jgi:lipoate-protein ligase A
MQVKSWRLIPYFCAPGALQMAIDQWMLEQQQFGHPPILRFYRWSSPAISLGYHQHRWPPHWETLTWQGVPIDLIRRPTGGRAVLHQGDLTYAIATSGLKGTRLQTYQQLCEFLIQGWRSLGIELDYGQARRGDQHQANCFGTATRADLVLADGTKLIGSAQLHRSGAILQHGSMQLAPDPALWEQVFGESPHPQHLRPYPQPLSQKWERGAKSKLGTLSKLIAAMVDAARTCFDVEFQLQPLSEAEWHTIKQVPLLKLDPQSVGRSPARL